MVKWLYYFIPPPPYLLQFGAHARPHFKIYDDLERDVFSDSLKLLSDWSSGSQRHLKTAKKLQLLEQSERTRRIITPPRARTQDAQTHTRGQLKISQHRSWLLHSSGWVYILIYLLKHIFHQGVAKLLVWRNRRWLEYPYFRCIADNNQRIL